MNKSKQVLTMSDTNKNEQINADEQFEDNGAVELDDDQLEDVAGGVEWGDNTDWNGVDWGGNG